MTETNSSRRLVRGGPDGTDQSSSSWIISWTIGAKNNQKGPGTYKRTKLEQKTWAHSLDLFEPEQELDSIRWNTAGLSEIRRKGHECLQSSEKRKIGFMFDKKLIPSIPMLDWETDRIWSTVIQISKKYIIRIMHQHLVILYT